MSLIYTIVGATFFWIVVVLFTLCAIYVSFTLWRDRARIRWPWQKRSA